MFDVGLLLLANNWQIKSHFWTYLSLIQSVIAKIFILGYLNNCLQHSAKKPVIKNFVPYSAEQIAFLIAKYHFYVS